MAPIFYHYGLNTPRVPSGNSVFTQILNIIWSMLQIKLFRWQHCQESGRWSFALSRMKCGFRSFLCPLNVGQFTLSSPHSFCHACCRDVERCTLPYSCSFQGMSPHQQLDKDVIMLSTGARGMGIWDFHLTSDVIMVR